MIKFLVPGSGILYATGLIAIDNVNVTIFKQLDPALLGSFRNVDGILGSL